MKSLKTIQTLYKIGYHLSKAAFIICIVGFCGCIVGFIGLNFGGNVLKIGGVTLHGLFSDKFGYDINSSFAALSGWLFVCAGNGVASKFAEIYFKNELAAGTPFTVSGSKELMRLGIITVAVPTGSAVLGSIIEGIVAGFLNAAKDSAMDMHFDNAVSVALGVMFIFVAVLCRYGAELNTPADSHEP